METFIVRLWVPSDGEPATLRGVVERVSTRESIPFVGDEQLRELLRRCSGHNDQVEIASALGETPGARAEFERSS